MREKTTSARAITSRISKPRRLMSARGLIAVSLAVVGVSCAFAAPAFAGLSHVYGSSFGEEGSEPGKLSHPSGLAVNEATGNVYVVDAGNKRVEEFTAAGVFIREFAPPGGFSEPQAIAVDNSSNPLDVSKEDVYVTDSSARVVDKFEAGGHYLASIGETEPGTGLGEAKGVAVDGEGHVWVTHECQSLAEFANSEPNAFVLNETASVGFCVRPGLGVDSEGDLWVVLGFQGSIAKISPAGHLFNPPGEQVGGEGHHGLAVDPGTNSVYLSSAREVSKYSSAGSELEAFGAGHLSEGEAIALDASTDTVYVADVSADAVRVFQAVLLPIVATTQASGLEHEREATLNGTVNPEGVSVSECKFEYGTSTAYGETVPCAQSAAEIGSGTSPVAVSANVSGLSVPSHYHYRLVASNANGEGVGHDEAFTAGAKPEILFPSVSATSSTEALVIGYMIAGGLATTYRVDYGLTEAYSSSTPELSLGTSTGFNPIRVELRGLSPSTRYYARLVARNAIGITEEKLESFTTPATPEPDTGLPDHRAYELVSPASEPGEVYVSMARSSDRVDTNRPARAAASGDAVTYPADPAATGGSGAQGGGFGDQFIARRGSSGWTASDFSPHLPPVTQNTPFEAFSADLSSAVYLETERLSPEAGVSAPAGCLEALYDYSLGAATFTPLFASTLTPGQCGDPRFAGASESWGQVLFQDEAPLVAGTHVNANASSRGFAGCVEGCNLYDASVGALSAVNVLPGGTSTVEGTFGGVVTNASGADWRVLGNIVAADGSRAFWTDTEPGADQGHIFVRVNPDQGQSALSGGVCSEPGKACTLPVSAGSASYLTATPDGRFVFYLEAGGLWRYDSDTAERQAVAGPSASVAGLVGASSDGEWVYFVADAALTSTPSPAGEVAQPRICEGYEAQEQRVRERYEKGEITEQEFHESHISSEQQEEGHDAAPPAHTGCNLYLWHAARDTFVGDLSPRDNELSMSSNADDEGDWRRNVATHTASLSPDGQHLVFTSFHALAGANTLAHNGGTEAYSEIYMFDAKPTARLVCVSCRPNGADPVYRGGETTGTYLPANLSEAFAPRWVSEDGSRVFFDSDQPLVADEPGSSQGVYEWEREGSGTCGVVTPARYDGGCISLLSGTSATGSSYFVEADPSGENVFIETRKQLTGQGTAERMMLYDVRVGGGFAEGSQACTGTGCQGVPPAGPSFAAPPSETFGGAGNFASAPGTKPTPKTLSPARRLAGALRACRRDRKRRTRARCERIARESYRRAVHAAAKKSTKKGPHHA